MPGMETITIINKSGKVVSTGKHLVNIFKDAKDAYNEKKASLKTEHRQRIEFKQAQKLLEAGPKNNDNDAQSIASSHRSHRSHRHRDKNGVSRPPLTARALSHIDEGSVASSRRSRSSHHGSRRASTKDVGSGHGHRSPYMEDAGPSQPNLTRRHTDFPAAAPHINSQLSRSPTGTLPPPYARSASNPDFHHRRSHSESDDSIDMNLAYGTPPLDLLLSQAPNRPPPEQAAELQATMTKLDHLLLEAHCVQHSATAIIKNLQDNPEAMAAVALTLAELSTLLSKMSPAILATLKTSSPAIFALLASPQFLIAGGLALGVTVVMFGGYKIVKKIQADTAAKKEANRMEEALVWDENVEMGSIESWRRGINAADGLDGTSVEGEFITPEAARQRKERIRERKREERRGVVRAGSVISDNASTVRGERTIRRVGSDDTIRLPVRSKTAGSVVAASVIAPSESISVRSSKSRREKDKGRETVSVKEKKTKEKKEEKSSGKKAAAASALSGLFHKSKKDKDGKESESGRSHRPRLVEV